MVKLNKNDTIIEESNEISKCYVCKGCPQSGPIGPEHQNGFNPIRIMILVGGIAFLLFLFSLWYFCCNCNESKNNIEKSFKKSKTNKSSRTSKRKR